MDWEICVYKIGSGIMYYGRWGQPLLFEKTCGGIYVAYCAQKSSQRAITGCVASISRRKKITVVKMSAVQQDPPSAVGHIRANIFTPSTRTLFIANDTFPVDQVAIMDWFDANAMTQMRELLPPGTQDAPSLKSLIGHKKYTRVAEYI